MSTNWKKLKERKKSRCINFREFEVRNKKKALHKVNSQRRHKNLNMHKSNHIVKLFVGKINKTSRRII